MVFILAFIDNILVTYSDNHEANIQSLNRGIIQHKK